MPTRFAAGRRAMLGICLATAALAGLATLPVIAVAQSDRDHDKIVIAHRGASGYLPEHTLEAYALAYGLGADYIEPDLVLTRDGVFICLHDVTLEETTNVAEVFPERHRGDGSWYSADFTLAEIQSLAAHERLPDRFPRANSSSTVPTLQQMILLIQGLNASTGGNVGIYPELKRPAWHRAQGLPMEEAFLEIVGRYGYRGPNARIFVQSFEAEPLERMRALGSSLPQVMLLSMAPLYDGMTTAEGLDRIAGFANGIGPDKSRIERDPSLVEQAHERGLVVHPYTLRLDQLPTEYESFDQELERIYFELDADGVFTDHPDRARRFLDAR